MKHELERQVNASTTHVALSLTADDIFKPNPLWNRPSHHTQINEQQVHQQDQKAAAGKHESFIDYTTGDKCFVPLTVEEFKRTATHLVSRLGAKANNFDLKDLSQLMDDPSIHGSEAIALATLYDLVAHTNDGEEGRNFPGYLEAGPLRIHSIADIQGIPAKSSEVLPKIRELVGKSGPLLFSTADTNHNNKLDARELAHSANYSALLKSLPDLTLVAKKHGGALTMGDLQDEKEKLMAQIYISDQVVNYQRPFLQRHELASTHRLFADMNNPLNSIKISDVNQGNTGDCYFEAVLAAQAKSDPAAIRDAIKDNRDGTFTVTFKGDPSAPVTINAPTEAELAVFNGGTSNGMWPAVMEKAFGQYLSETYRPYDNDLDTIDKAGRGGLPTGVTELLTGHKAVDPTGTFDTLFATIDRTRPPEPQAKIDIYKHSAEAISNALKASRLVTVDIDQHTYTVVAMKRLMFGDKVTLRNPWGDKQKELEYIVVTLDAMLSKATGVAVESNEEIAPLSSSQRNPHLY